ncbi:MAG: response regulator transcription factor [Cytophagales bacterium]|nr:response regulator transcription factor [Armatimonadota bacterium]
MSDEVIASSLGVAPAELGKLTAVIVDDEPLAREHLRRMLEEQRVAVVGEAEGAAQALQLAEDLRPHLLFLDIQMPGLTGLQFAEALQQSTSDALIIFVTGYSEYAAQAFEQAALDYLMKPVSPVRLAKTLVRARERLAVGTAARSEIARRLTEQILREPARLQRLPIRKDYAVLLVRVEEIRCAIARDKRVLVRTEDGGEHRTYYTLTQLETLLPPERFLRIHDSAIVRIDAVEELLLLGNHSYAVRLSGKDQLPVGRARYALLQQRLGLSAPGLAPLEKG